MVTVNLFIKLCTSTSFDLTESSSDLERKKINWLVRERNYKKGLTDQIHKVNRIIDKYYLFDIKFEKSTIFFYCEI